MKVLIISGAGIIAGTHFYNEFLKELIGLKKFKKDSDFPEIVLYNYPFSSIKNNGELDEVEGKKELEAILDRFPEFNYVVIACNTFHVLKLDNSKILSLPGHVLAEIESIAERTKKVLVLCSSYSREKKLFDNKDVVYPSSDLNLLMDRIISSNIYSLNSYTKEDFEQLNEFIKNKNITHLIVGCTELSLIDWENIVEIPVIDSNKLIIKNLISKIESKE
jgi:aspartate/glutamate racemase